MSILRRLLLTILAAGILPCALLMCLGYVSSLEYGRDSARASLTQWEASFQHYVEEDYGAELRLMLEQLAASPTLDAYLMGSEAERLVEASRLERQFLQAAKRNPAVCCVRFVDRQGVEQVAVANGRRALPRRDSEEGDGHLHGDRLDELFERLTHAKPGTVHTVGVDAGARQDVAFSAGIGKLDTDTGEFGGAVIIDCHLHDFVRRLGGLEVLGSKVVWVFSPEGDVIQAPAEGEFVLDPRSVATGGGLPDEGIVNVPEGVLVRRDLQVSPGVPVVRVVAGIPSALLDKEATRLTKRMMLVLACAALLGGLCRDCSFASPLQAPDIACLRGFPGRLGRPGHARRGPGARRSANGRGQLQQDGPQPEEHHDVEAVR